MVNIDDFASYRHVAAMEGFITEEDLDLFYAPARIIVAGFSGSGKTNIVCEIVRKYAHKFEKIIVCGVRRHPLQEVASVNKKLVVYSSIVDPLPDDDDFDANKQRLFILDDAIIEASESKYVVDAFTKGRHSNLSTVLITQNVFFNGKHARNITLNATHYLLMRQRDKNQIECLGRQIYGKDRSKEFLEIYNALIKIQTYGYLLVDLSVKSSVLHQFRTNIVGERPYEIVVKWKENGNY